MPSLSPGFLDQTKLNVVAKARSNIFNWRGQFTPQFVEYLLDTFASSSDLVLDPFCGSGTVLLEAARKNIRSAGCEINPAAYAMTKFVTLSNLPPDERRHVFHAVKANIEKLNGNYNHLPLFGAQLTFRDRYKNLLEFARELLKPIKNKREMLLALIMLLYAEKNGKGDLITSVRSACETVSTNLLTLPYTTSPLQVNLCDARLAHRQFSSTVDVIITSPPYINVFNYHQNHRALLEILGFDLLRVAESEIGSNRKNRSNRFRTVVQYALDMEQALVSFAKSLKSRGILILVVGRESCVRGIPISNSGLLRTLAASLCCYQQESENERVFTNRYGQQIKEDNLVLRRTEHIPLGGHARVIAKSYLQSSLGLATGDVRNDIAEALNRIEDVAPSLLFDKKEII